MSSSRDRHPAASRPAVDEWGIYDPEQAGLQALFDRLEQNASEMQATDPLRAKDATASPLPFSPKRRR